MITVVGILTLLTDLWRAQEWLVPRGPLITPAGWQALLAGSLLSTFLVWAWFALLRPPIYGTANAVPYAHALYLTILKGDPAEMAAVADEVRFSARSLISFATETPLEDSDKPLSRRSKRERRTKGIANELLELIADRRFCRVVVGSSPVTALALFEEIGRTGKHGVPIETFGTNILNEALLNRDSFLFHETERYYTGLLGALKPLTQAMFSNHQMVHRLGLLDPDVHFEWNAERLKAYLRITLMTFADFVERDGGRPSAILYRAASTIKGSIFDLYKLDGLADFGSSDATERVSAVVEFITDAVKILDEKGGSISPRRRLRKAYCKQETCHDLIARLAEEVVLGASRVRSPRDACWTIQYVVVWSHLFSYDAFDRPAGQIILFKIRRLLFEHISEMTQFPNYKGAGVLSLCLNVMGFVPSKSERRSGTAALHRAVMSWTKKNFAWLHSFNPRVADHALPERVTYQPKRQRLVRTNPIEHLRRKEERVFFALDPPPPEGRP